MAVRKQSAASEIPTAIKQETKAVSEQVTITQEKVKEGMEKAMRKTEELVAFGQDNVAAFVKSGQILANGLQDMSKYFAVAAQASVDEAVANFKALSSVKSLKEVFDLQTSVAKGGVEKAISESGKLTDATFKLAEQAFAPLGARITVATEKFAKTA